jgi:hypothetical protein
MASPALHQCRTACTGAVSSKPAGSPPSRSALPARSRRSRSGSRASRPCRPSTRCSASRPMRTSCAPCSRRCCGLRNELPLLPGAASRSPRPHRLSSPIKGPTSISSICGRSPSGSGPTGPATAAGRSHAGSSARARGLRSRNGTGCGTSPRSRSWTISSAASTSAARTPRSSRSCSRASGRRRSPRAATAPSRRGRSSTTRRHSARTNSPNPSCRARSSPSRRTHTGRGSRPASRCSRSGAIPRWRWRWPTCAPGRSTSCRWPTGRSSAGLGTTPPSADRWPSCTPCPSSP